MEKKRTSEFFGGNVNQNHMAFPEEIKNGTTPMIPSFHYRVNTQRKINQYLEKLFMSYSLQYYSQ